MSYRQGRGGGRRSSHYRGRRRSFSSQRRITTFDPSHLVQEGVKVKQNIYEPKLTLSDLPLGEKLQANIRGKGYTNLTAIQDQVIPLILEGKDVVGIANTGTGKTAAFLIPLIENVRQQRAKRVLVVSPTRELSNQTAQECRELSYGLNINSSICIGGVPIFRQIQQMRRQPAFVIGTPGRLKDLHKRGELTLQNFSTIVLDEVDQMLDMGFIHDIKYLIEHMGTSRQSLFFSATISTKAREVMRAFLTDPVVLSVKTSDRLANINQDIIRLAGRSKVEILHELLSQKGFDKVLVFGGTKFSLNKLERNLVQRGHRVGTIHGNKSQNQRQRVLQAFRDNYLSILLATDVASRGLDIDNVTHVINYDLPQSYEDYIHRIGRTGRADKAGTALTFVE